MRDGYLFLYCVLCVVLHNAVMYIVYLYIHILVIL